MSARGAAWDFTHRGLAEADDAEVRRRIARARAAKIAAAARGDLHATLDTLDVDLDHDPESTPTPREEPVTQKEQLLAAARALEARGETVTVRAAAIQAEMDVKRAGILAVDLRKQGLWTWESSRDRPPAPKREANPSEPPNGSAPDPEPIARGRVRVVDLVDPTPDPFDAARQVLAALRPLAIADRVRVLDLARDVLC